MPSKLYLNTRFSLCLLLAYLKKFFEYFGYTSTKKCLTSPTLTNKSDCIVCLGIVMPFVDILDQVVLSLNF